MAVSGYTDLLKKCSCKFSKDNISGFPEIKVKLPVAYKYTICEWAKIDEQHFDCRFRVNISTKDGALLWLEKFKFSSNTSYTKDKTYHENTQNNVFKVSLKCHRNTRPKNNVIQASPQHTNCPARLVITVKQTALSRKYKSSDVHLQEFPMIVIYRNRHNHSIDSDILKYYLPNSDVKNMFINYFEEVPTTSKMLHYLCNNEEQTQKDKKAVIKEFYDCVQIIAERAESNTETMHVIENFVNNFKKLQTENSLNSGLNCFEKFSRFSRNWTKNLGVQPMPLVRCLYGGSSTVQSGQPSKRNSTEEDGYSKIKKTNTAAPHIVYCKEKILP